MQAIKHVPSSMCPLRHTPEGMDRITLKSMSLRHTPDRMSLRHTPEGMDRIMCS
jgi:hypothetical protein